MGRALRVGERITIRVGRPRQLNFGDFIYFRIKGYGNIARLRLRRLLRSVRCKETSPQSENRSQSERRLKDFTGILNRTAHSSLHLNRNNVAST